MAPLVCCPIRSGVGRRGRSSVGRAPQSHCGGQGFKSPRLHQLSSPLSQLGHSEGRRMATIRQRGRKWQVQVRHVGQRAVSRSFYLRKDAETWARQIEVQSDRNELPPDRRALQHTTLGDLVQRYRDTVSPIKRGHDRERYILTAFLCSPDMLPIDHVNALTLGGEGRRRCYSSLKHMDSEGRISGVVSTLAFSHANFAYRTFHS